MRVFYGQCSRGQCAQALVVRGNRPAPAVEAVSGGLRHVGMPAGAIKRAFSYSRIWAQHDLWGASARPAGGAAGGGAGGGGAARGVGAPPPPPPHAGGGRGFNGATPAGQATAPAEGRDPSGLRDSGARRAEPRAHVACSSGHIKYPSQGPAANRPSDGWALMASGRTLGGAAPPARRVFYMPGCKDHVCSGFRTAALPARSGTNGRRCRGSYAPSGGGLRQTCPTLRPNTARTKDVPMPLLVGAFGRRWCSSASIRALSSSQCPFWLGPSVDCRTPATTGFTSGCFNAPSGWGLR